MKRMKNKMWMMGLLFVALFGLSSCEIDEDYMVASNISGHWFGDLDMWYGNEKARGSEIEFIPSSYNAYRGRGTEVDYYRRGRVVHYFDWFVRDGVIYLRFDDPYLDCAIANYRLNYSYFSGDIADYYTLRPETHFRLRNYEHYWHDYGYDDYYYVKGESNWDEAADSIADAHEENAVYIRGVNKARYAGE